jgi:hypothetical protein
MHAAISTAASARCGPRIPSFGIDRSSLGRISPRRSQEPASVLDVASNRQKMRASLRAQNNGNVVSTCARELRIAGNAIVRVEVSENRALYIAGSF